MLCGFIMHRSIILNFKESNFGDMMGPQVQLQQGKGWIWKICCEGKGREEVRTPL